MLKLILIGVWVAVVTLGSVYASIELSKPEDPGAEAARQKANQALVRGEMVTFPIIANGSVQGYFLTRTSYIVDKTKMAEVTLPIPALLTDELYTALVGDRVIRIKDEGNFNVRDFRDKIKKALNARLGVDAVLDVIIEQVDYLSKDEIRKSQDQQVSVKSGEKIIAEQVPSDIAVQPQSDSTTEH